MKPAKTINPQDWMTAPETVAVMAALGDGNALFVGGCVRNTLLGEAVEDIDIATTLTPDEVTTALKGAGLKAVPTGIEHGTITAVSGGKPYEITTLRKDVKTDGRHATVAFSKDWAEDAARRDFTMNTLLADPRGNIFDPLGQGLTDLESRKVVFVGDPSKRIEEDTLRILRYFRFHALYADGNPAPEALAACKAASDKIPSLSKERITQEFFKILSTKRCVSILNIMFENNILYEFSVPEYDPDLLKHLCGFQDRYGLAFIASRLWVLAGFSREALQKFETLLLIPKVFKKDIEAIAGVLALPDLAEDHAVKVAIYRYGRVPTAQALMIELANDRVINGYAPTAINIIQNWDVPDFPVSGEDLIKKGVPQGPELGRELERLEDEWIANGFKPG